MCTKLRHFTERESDDWVLKFYVHETASDTIKNPNFCLCSSFLFLFLFENWRVSCCVHSVFHIFPPLDWFATTEGCFFFLHTSHAVRMFGVFFNIYASHYRLPLTTHFAGKVFLFS